MKDELLDYLAPREERLPLGPRTLIVREMESAADTAAFIDNADMTWKLLVRCVFAEDGNLVFSDGDIPKLKRSSKVRVLPLIEAVRRVNGIQLEAEEKNSDAGPGAG